MRVRACVACTELTTDNVLEAYDFPAHIDGWAIDSLLEPLRSAGASTQVLLQLLVVVTHSLARTHAHNRHVLLPCVYVCNVLLFMYYCCARPESSFSALERGVFFLRYAGIGARNFETICVLCVCARVGYTSHK